MNINFGANKTSFGIIKKHLEERILDTFILVLMVNGKASNGKCLISWKILTSDFIAKIFMTIMSLNMSLNAEHH